MAPNRRRGGKYERDTGYRPDASTTRSLSTPYGRRSTRAAYQAAEEAESAGPGEAVRRSTRVSMQQETASYSQVNNDAKTKAKSRSKPTFKMHSSQDTKQKENEEEDDKEERKMRRKQIPLLPPTTDKRLSMSLEKYRYEGPPSGRPVVSIGTSTGTPTQPTTSHTDDIKGKGKGREVDNFSDRSSSPLSSLPESDPPSPVLSPFTSRDRSLSRTEGEGDEWRPSMMNQSYSDVPNQAGHNEGEKKETGPMVDDNRTTTLSAADTPNRSQGVVAVRVKEVAAQQAVSSVQSSPDEQTRNDLLSVPQQSVPRFAPARRDHPSEQEQRPRVRNTKYSWMRAPRTVQQSCALEDQKTLRSPQHEVKAIPSEPRPKPLPSALVLQLSKSSNPHVPSIQPQSLPLANVNTAGDTASARVVEDGHCHDQRVVINAPFKPSPLNQGWTTVSSDSDPGNRSATPVSEVAFKDQNEVTVPEQKHQPKVFKTPFFHVNPLDSNPNVICSSDTTRREAQLLQRQRPVFVRTPLQRDRVTDDKLSDASAPKHNGSASPTPSRTALEVPKVTSDVPSPAKINVGERSNSTLVDALASLKAYAVCLTNITRQAAPWQGIDRRKGANDIHQAAASSSEQSQNPHGVQSQDQIRSQSKEAEQEDRWRTAIDIWAEAPRLPIQYPVSYERTRISLSPDEEDSLALALPLPHLLPPAPAPTLAPASAATTMILGRTTRRKSF